MRDLRSPAPRHEQTCPVCGAQLAAGALYCEACGTDLSRSGALFSTNVKPVSLRRSRKVSPRLGQVAKIAAGAVAGVAVLTALGSVPAVSARVPVLGTLGYTVQRLLGTAPRSNAPDPGQIEEGSLMVVRSSPPGARVYLDDQYVGTTPMSRENVSLGTHQVRISRDGYLPVSRTIEVGEGPLALEVSLRWTIDTDAETSYPSTRTPAPPQGTVRPLPTVRPPLGERRPPLAAGTAAPAFVLKDRFGVLHKLESFRGHKTGVLFVWALDDDARRAIVELDMRVQRSKGTLAGAVVIMQTDRGAVRTFVAGLQARVPILIGTQRVAQQYQVTTGVDTLYVISERGVVLRSQTGVIRPGDVLR